MRATKDGNHGEAGRLVVIMNAERFTQYAVRDT